MFKLPYDTTPCRDYIMDRIAKEIGKAFVLGDSQFQFVKHPRTGEMISAFMLVPGPSDIAPFAHPLYIDDLPGQGKSSLLVVDVRNFTRRSPTGDAVVSSKLDYDTAIMRVLLQSAWMKHDPMDLLGLGSFQVTVFARWLVEQLHRRLGLTPDVQMNATIIAAYYYICMFHDKAEFDESDKLKIAQLISRSTYIAADVAVDLIDDFPVHRSAADLVSQLVNSSGSARFEKFNLELLYSIVGGSWFGSNAREMVAVALEHPPTFIALMAQAVNERGFHNTELAKVVDKYDKGNAAKTFATNIWHLPVN